MVIRIVQNRVRNEPKREYPVGVSVWQIIDL